LSAYYKAVNSTDESTVSRSFKTAFHAAQQATLERAIRKSINPTLQTANGQSLDATVIAAD